MRLEIHDFVDIDLVDPPNELAEFVEEELGHFEVDGSAPEENNSDITVKFVDELPIVGKREYISVYAGYDDASLFVMDGWQHKATVPFDDLDGNCKIICEKGFDPLGFLLLLENLLRYKLILKGAVLIHASAVSYHGQGIIFPAWANTGKTNLLLQFLNEGASYISDDFAIIREDGLLYSYPRRLQLLHYNFSEFPDLIKILDIDVRLNFLKRRLSTKLLKRLPRVPLLTRFLRRMNRISIQHLHRRVPVKAFYPQIKVGGPTRIDKVFFLVRTGSQNTKIERVAREVVAGKMVSCVSFERHYPYDYRLLYRFAYPTRGNNLLEQIEGLEQKVMLRSMANSDVYYVRLANNYTSVELFQCVKKHSL